MGKGAEGFRSVAPGELLLLDMAKPMRTRNARGAPDQRQPFQRSRRSGGKHDRFPAWPGAAPGCVGPSRRLPGLADRPRAGVDGRGEAGGGPEPWSSFCASHSVRTNPRRSPLAPSSTPSVLKAHGALSTPTSPTIGLAPIRSLPRSAFPAPPYIGCSSRTAAWPSTSRTGVWQGSATPCPTRRKRGLLQPSRSLPASPVRATPAASFIRRI